jgi:hypothetical protein
MASGSDGKSGRRLFIDVAFAGVFRNALHVFAGTAQI